MNLVICVFKENGLYLNDKYICDLFLPTEKSPRLWKARPSNITRVFAGTIALILLFSNPKKDFSLSFIYKKEYFNFLYVILFLYSIQSLLRERWCVPGEKLNGADFSETSDMK